MKRLVIALFDEIMDRNRLQDHGQILAAQCNAEPGNGPCCCKVFWGFKNSSEWNLNRPLVVSGRSFYRKAFGVLSCIHLQVISLGCGHFIFGSFRGKIHESEGRIKPNHLLMRWYRYVRRGTMVPIIEKAPISLSRCLFLFLLTGFAQRRSWKPGAIVPHFFKVVHCYYQIRLYIESFYIYYP